MSHNVNIPSSSKTDVLVDQALVWLPSVQIIHARSCSFKLKKGTKHVCGRCGKTKLHPVHGAFSYNLFGGGSNRFVWQKLKEDWEMMLLSLLAKTNLQKPCRRIEVSGLICFPNRFAHDEDNYRFLYSKYLGDALQKGGYLEDDDWSSFRFRELDRVEPVKGVQWTSLLLRPQVYATDSRSSSTIEIDSSSSTAT